MDKKSLWGFGTREVVYAAIGAALYGVFSWVTNFLALPAAGNIALRPAVAIPMFFGIAFGPIVGFFTGFVGNMLGDFLSGWGFWWAWCLGNGIMGLIPGLIGLLGAVVSFKDKGTLIKAEVLVVVAALVGMLVPSLLEMPLSGIDLNTALTGYWLPAALSNIINGSAIPGGCFIITHTGQPLSSNSRMRSQPCPQSQPFQPIPGSSDCIRPSGRCPNTGR